MRALEVLDAGRFFGNVVHSLPLDGVVLSEIHHSSGVEVARHGHELAFFCLLLTGGYREEVDGDVIPYETRSVGFHAPRSAHQDEIGSGGARFFCIEFEDRFLDRIGGEPSYAYRHLGPASELAWLALRVYQHFRNPGIRSPLAVEGILLEMLAGVAGPSHADPEEPDWYADVKAFLHAHYCRPIRVETLSDLAGVHPVHLARVFRRLEKTTVRSYVRALRVQQASELLIESDLSLAEVSLDSGFSDQSHFSRAFKSHTGMTPNRFRQLLKSRS